MRLDKVRLAGFKSFVDPTSIPLPGNLVGIVGPNGCGKSNIIDAVRWVMGESSAKHLRGESMADVIFNGSSTRKPVGIASVELVFDNSDGGAPGEYAKYREISIKRQVSRDGASVYLLNGSRCRRKDITDIFLGTGLGARSYAIIEQGTISRLIEAKPDELRAVIEEAAGISKYKERRQETEVRMRHTLENLERLQDVRDEVAKHLANLQRQAKKAEKYAALKEEERLYRRQLLGIRWRKYELSLGRQKGLLIEYERRFRILVGEGSVLDEDEQAARERRDKLQQSLNDKQGRFYELGAEISRLEQVIKHARQTRESLSRESERLRGEQLQLHSQWEQDLEQIETAREELAGLESALREAQRAEIEAEEKRTQADRALKAFQSEWESLKSEFSRHKNRTDVERARIRQIEDVQRSLRQRSDKLTAERDEVEDALMDDELQSLMESLSVAEEEQGKVHERLNSLQQSVKEERARAKSCREELDLARSEIHSIEGKISSLRLLQQHAMGRDRASLNQWLREADLEKAARLAEHLDVSPGWEPAVENVLGVHLEAVCVDDAGRYLPLLENGGHPETLAFFETRKSNPESTACHGGKLLDCIRSEWNLSTLLGDVYRADDLPKAREICQRLEEHESVVTPDGAWMGRDWLVMMKPVDGKAGVLARERELRGLLAASAELRKKAGELDALLAMADEGVRAAESEREQRQSEFNRGAADISALKSQISAAAVHGEQSRKRLQRLELELDELEESLQGSAEEKAEASANLHASENDAAGLERTIQSFGDRQRDLEENAQKAESALREARDRVHGLRSRTETLKSAESLSLKHLERARVQVEQTRERLDDLDRRIQESGAPTDDEQEDLEEQLRQRKLVEQDLANLRAKISDVDSQLRDLGEMRMRKERELEALKKDLEQAKFEAQGDEVRLQTIREQFDELGVEPETSLLDLPEDADEKNWQQRLNQLVEEIGRLGAVNLTAMEEYQEQSERLRILDEQRSDLAESQATLTQAIEKIDRECRARFKDTFDRVNEGIQRMFPKLFGGGQAYLELCERDLLETGVTIMARPPGKRNSSIHLLSGGEKALTAVSLVFSIFELNPAPFCLLDEVDAPLDDANVGRFGALVKEMSEKVQFLFISHNKATMEIAQHLAGVTMKEPGVSRIVAVDIDQAIELAAH